MKRKTKTAVAFSAEALLTMGSGLIGFARADGTVNSAYFGSCAFTRF